MEKLCFLLLIAFCISSFAFSQEKNKSALWHLTIVDSATNQGIVRATISVDSGKYLSTNDRGQISLRKDLLYKTDTLYISSVGYRTALFIPGFRVKLPDTIPLVAAVTALKEVAINPNSTRGIILGDFKKKYNSHRTTSPEERKTHLTVDISKYNIQLPEDGIMVALETLPSAYYGKDSVWYYGQLRARTPGIDMDLKKRRDYSTYVKDLSDRKTTYSMVIDAADEWDIDQLMIHSYLYDDGNNYAITITIAPD